MPDLKDPTSQGTLMEPVFFATGQRLTKGVTDERRRHSLAEWMTARDNPWFAKAFVNRIWSELVGEGFYEPIDDLGPDRQCSAPQTMDYLAGQFMEHGYDVKWLLRTIMATDDPDGRPDGVLLQRQHLLPGEFQASHHVLASAARRRNLWSGPSASAGR